MRRTRTQYVLEFVKGLLWIGLMGAGIITLLALNHGHDPSEPLPETTVTQTVPVPLPEATTVPAIAEDDPKWKCQTQGNHICGPGSGAPAGCYSGGVLVIPWTNYTDPHADPLWAQLNPPC